MFSDIMLCGLDDIIRFLNLLDVFPRPLQKIIRPFEKIHRRILRLVPQLQGMIIVEQLICPDTVFIQIHINNLRHIGL